MSIRLLLICFVFAVVALVGLHSCRSSDHADGLSSLAAYSEDTLAIRRLKDSVYEYLFTRPDSALKILEVMKQKADRIGYEKGIVSYYTLACDAYSRNGQQEKAEELAEQFLQYAYNRSPYLKFKAYFIKGLVFAANTETSDSAIRYNLQALAALNAHPGIPVKTYEVTDLYSNLAIQHYYQHNYKSALEYSRLAELRYRQERDTAPLLRTMRLTIYTYMKVGDSVRAFRDAREQEQIARQVKDSLSLFSAWNILGTLYLEMNQIDSSMSYLNKAVHLLKTNGYSMMRDDGYFSLAECYLRRKDFDSAAYWLSEEKKLIDAGLTDVKEEHGYYELLSSVMERKGNLTLAYSSLKKAYDLWTEISKHDKDEQLLEHEKSLAALKSERELLKKEQQIYNEQQKSKQLVFGGSLLLAVASYSTYRWNRKRTRKREQLITNLRHQAYFNQMKPHFIFNAIAPLQNQIMSGKVTEALEYLSDFGKIMRRMLVQFDTSFSTVASVMDFIVSYLKIQQQAANFPFTFQISVDPDIDQHDTWMPAMLLQPILENSIVHGINSIPNGHIDITVEKRGQFLSIVVLDNGTGLPSGKDYIQNGHALKIMGDRLELMKDKYGAGQIEMENRSDTSGVRIAILVPLMNSNPEEG